jgi:hypothetical protein
MNEADTDFADALQPSSKDWEENYEKPIGGVFASIECIMMLRPFIPLRPAGDVG